MKFAVIIALIFWLVCGMAGAWMLGELDRQDWKAVARGPITLHEALNDDPVTLTGQQ
jgi:hypothetical protein